MLKHLNPKSYEKINVHFNAYFSNAYFSRKQTS